MRDAATCRAMEAAAAPQASLSALTALGTLLSETMARRGMTVGAAGSERIGFGDGHQGDRHAASAKPFPTPTARAVADEPAAATASSVVMDDAAGANPARPDRADDAHADRPRQMIA